MHKQTPSKLGFTCECGERFVTQAKLDEHIADEVERAKQPEYDKPAAERFGEPVELDPSKQVTDMNEIKKKEAPVAEPKETVAPEPVQDKQVAKTEATAVSPLQETANMVRVYAGKLINDERAQQFYAQMSLMMKDNPKLAVVDPRSFLSSVMACVHLDLMPNTPEGYAYIIPYGNNAQFQLGYKGMIELASRTGNIRKIDAELVFKGDTFKVALGTERTLVHEPSLDEQQDRTDYKNVTHAYATAKLSSGDTVFVYLTRSELDKVQKSAKAQSTDAPWKTWPEAMARKTAVKRLLKLLPSSTEDNRLKIAAEWDSLNEAGKRLQVDERTGDLRPAERIELPNMDDNVKDEAKAIAESRKASAK